LVGHHAGPSPEALAMPLIIGVGAIGVLVAAISLVDWFVNGRERREAQDDHGERYRRFLGLLASIRDARR
jgi:hypothetical protein